MHRIYKHYGARNSTWHFIRMPWNQMLLTGCTWGNSDVIRNITAAMLEVFCVAAWCNVINLRGLSNCCVRNYTPVSNPRTKIASFRHFSSMIIIRFLQTSRRVLYAHFSVVTSSCAFHFWPKYSRINQMNVRFFGSPSSVAVLNQWQIIVVTGYR